MQTDIATAATLNKASNSMPEWFAGWVAENQHIWLAFEREALAVWNRGHQRYSARTIIEFLRHHTAITERNGAWKINNNAAPYLARMFEAAHPKLKGFFQQREQGGQHA